jgi:lipid A 3-O-deacylase
MYTPDDIEDPRPIPDDHPYNGYLYVGAFLQREKDATLDHFQLEIGVIGEASLAGSAQDFVHDVRDFDRPRGWRHQHSDEMMVQSYIRKKWRIDGVDFGMAGEPGDFDIIPQVGIAMGTFVRHLEGALTVRLGDNLPQDYGPGRLLDIGYIPTERPAGWNWYLFGRLGGRIVEHSQVLDAKAFAVDEETFVGEAGGGLAVSYLKDDFSFDFQYSQTFYTHTFEGQHDSDAYGSFTFSFSWHY